MKYSQQNGQALVEMAIFGTLVLLVFGILLSFLQLMNDQQYVQMEAFRTALQSANTGAGPFQEGAGASIDLTLIKNRRHVDVSGDFQKRNPLSLSASSSVFWAIPKVGTPPLNLVVFKINEDPALVENILSSLELPSINLPIIGETNFRFTIRNIASESDTEFRETAHKQENQTAITTQRNSALKDTITTRISYTIAPGGLPIEPDPNYYPPLFEHDIRQRLYRDASGQYTYSQIAPDAPVNRGRRWETRF